MDLKDLTTYLGLAGIYLLSVNVLLGLLMSARYNPWKRWPHRRINLLCLKSDGPRRLLLRFLIFPLSSNWIPLLATYSVLSSPKKAHHWLNARIDMPCMQNIAATRWLTE